MNKKYLLVSFLYLFGCAEKEIGPTYQDHAIEDISLSGDTTCSLVDESLIPINDLGAGFYRGYKGGYYPSGSNNRPAGHLAQALSQVSMIQPLNVLGNPDPVSGKIVMIGVGASNPAKEFQQFVSICNTATGINSQLVFVNTCQGGQGIQKMNFEAAEYWLHAKDSLTNRGLDSSQVQIVWVETENTQKKDTAFPAAPEALVNDYRLLMQTIRIKYPNAKICYLSPRAYSGYALPTSPVGNGLKFPRDYYNGWAVKWLIERQIKNKPGYRYTGAGASLPFITFGSYHWTNGYLPRVDGLLLECAEVGADGLHLTVAGEIKMAQKMFEYFSTDETAASWFFE